MAPGRGLDALKGAGGGFGAGPRWGAWRADGATEMGGVAEKIWCVASVWCEGAAVRLEVWPAEPRAEEGCWGVGVTARRLWCQRDALRRRVWGEGKVKLGFFPYRTGKTNISGKKRSIAS